MQGASLTRGGDELPRGFTRIEVPPPPIGSHPLGRDKEKPLTEWSRQGASHPEMPLFVSYFTNRFYLAHAFELVRTLLSFDLDFYVHEERDRGSWVKNTAHKPQFLAEVCADFPARHIVWLDADARVRAHPGLFREVTAPIGFHTFKGKKGRPGPCSGTVFLRAGPQRENVMREWILQCAANGTTLSDQECMTLAMSRLGIQHHELPAEYCWIFDLQQGTERPNPMKAPHVVIEHMQASRAARKMERM